MCNRILVKTPPCFCYLLQFAVIIYHCCCLLLICFTLKAFQQFRGNNPFTSSKGFHTEMYEESVSLTVVGRSSIHWTQTVNINGNSVNKRRVFHDPVVALIRNNESHSDNLISSHNRSGSVGQSNTLVRTKISQ